MVKQFRQALRGIERPEHCTFRLVDVSFPATPRASMWRAIALARGACEYYERLSSQTWPALECKAYRAMYLSFTAGKGLPPGPYGEPDRDNATGKR